MQADFQTLDATAMADLVRKREVSAVELVDAAIERIEALEPTIGALASHDFERARATAASVTEGPFAGVPFLLKDLLAYPGLPNTCGSRALARFVPPQGSPYSDAFDAAGLVTLGKTTTSELGLLGSTETLLHGPTKNPWNLERSATGSSGGSAAAVAAGYVPFAHASDGGGSIRIPSAACGLFGMKPTRGRTLPTGMEAGDLLGMLSEHCVSRTVRDSARLLHATQGEAIERMPLVLEPSERRLRIGFYGTTLLGASASEAVTRSLHSTVALLGELGHEVVEADAPRVEGADIRDAFFVAAGAGVAGFKAMVEGIVGRALGADDLEPFSLELLAWFGQQPPDALDKARAATAIAAAKYLEYIDGFDVLLCPTTPDPAPPLGTLAPTKSREELVRQTQRLAGYTPIHSVAGVPAMSVPSGLTDDGLPIGMHFAAHVGREDVLFGLAYALEAARPFARPKLAV